VDICPLRQQFLDCEGHALVLGGPGSGKTTIALRKAVKRIENGLAPGQSVMFLSFTRAAVARIAEAAKIEAPKRQRSLLNLQTFHSFFWELLSAHSYLLGGRKRLVILMPHDERALSGGIKEDKDPEEWATWLIERERLYREEGRIAFDLFGPNAAALLEKSAHLLRLVAQRYPLIIVDEAQDTWPHAWRCIELLAPQSQVICLADLEQQIFDYIPGIGPERIEAIKSSLVPLVIDLGSDNHRSPSSEIVAFGNDLLTGKARGKVYKGVSRIAFNFKTSTPTQRLRIALAILHKNIRKETGQWGRSVAILVPSGPAAAKVSAALSAAARPVKHKLLFDENEALLAARFAAFLLEPKYHLNRLSDLARAFELLADIKKASGSAQSVRLLVWAHAILNGNMPKAGIVMTLLVLMDDLRAAGFTGDPRRDWLTVKNALRSSGQPELAKVAGHLEYLVAFNRGKRISANLSETWQRDGQYTKAREALDLALAQDQILDGVDDSNGLQVMTIHKSKGKQFDGVIVARDSRHDGVRFVSNFVWWDDPAPHSRSRRILRVAVTRAKVHALILEPAWPVCPILNPHTL
jgi:DNA helicase-2/ATP-dependent DNA helicase PcrA